jgi:glycosyltransferase involved in cell wall biosynthesis
MRIIYLTQWFEPEPNIVKGISFVRGLEAAGHDVTVVTGLPNYPTGRLYPGYRFQLVQRETFDGVKIVRLPLYPSHDASSVRRSLNYLSFFLSAFLYCLFRGGRYDLAYVYHPPITVGLAAALAGRFRRLPFVLDIQDLWPDTLAAVGMAGAARLAPLLGRICAFVYRSADAIIVQSEGMRLTLIEREVPEQKVATIYNWAEIEASPLPPIHPPDPRVFTLVYGGNLGRAQALETVIDAAALVQKRRDDIRILIQGDGLEAESLRRRTLDLNVRNLEFRARVGRDEIVTIFGAADALLMHLRDDPLFAITVPSKTQFYLAMGKPIIAGIAGETADLLQRSGAALLVAPGDAEALAEAIVNMADLPRDRRAAMGSAGLRFYRENLAFDRALLRTIALLEGTNPERRQSD